MYITNHIFDASIFLCSCWQEHKIFFLCSCYCSDPSPLLWVARDHPIHHGEEVPSVIDLGLGPNSSQKESAKFRALIAPCTLTDRFWIENPDADVTMSQTALQASSIFWVQDLKVGGCQGKKSSLAVLCTVVLYSVWCIFISGIWGTTFVIWWKKHNNRLQL